MKLHALTITASSDADPTLIQSFTWRAGDEIFSVECAIAKLQEYVDSTKASLALALKAQKPLDTPALK